MDFRAVCGASEREKTEGLVVEHDGAGAQRAEGVLKKSSPRTVRPMERQGGRVATERHKANEERTKKKERKERVK